jgi:hypothetical protein
MYSISNFWHLEETLFLVTLRFKSFISLGVVLRSQSINQLTKLAWWSRNILSIDRIGNSVHLVDRIGNMCGEFESQISLIIVTVGPLRRTIYRASHRLQTLNKRPFLNEANVL